jgi:hypothetical protein
VITRDIGGNATTEEFTNELIRIIRRQKWYLKNG